MPPKLDPGELIWFHAGGDLELHLMRTGDEPPPSAHFCLAVDSGLDELRARLEAAGVETRTPTEIVGRPRFMCSDPVRQLRRADRAARVTEALVGARRRHERRQGARALTDGRGPRARRARVSALDPAARLGRAGSRGLVARDRGRARRPRGRAGVARLLGPDARPRRARRGRDRVASRDPLERPAHRGGVRRDRAAPRPRAPDRADRQPRAHRLHRAEAPLAPQPRAGDATRRSATSSCRRTTSASGSPASVRSTSPTPPGRSSSTSATGAGATRCWTRSSSRASGCRPRTSRTEIAGAGDQAAGALGVGVDRPGPLSVVLGTSGVVFAALESYRRAARRALHTFCHAVPGTWHAMGVMLSAAGSLQWLRRARRPVATTSCCAKRPRGRPAPKVSSSSRTSGRAHAARRSRRPRRVRRPHAQTRPRRA